MTKIESKAKASTLIILIIGGIGSCAVSYYLYLKSIGSEYPQLGELVPALLSGTLGVSCFVGIWLLEKFEFDGEKLVVKSIFNTPKKTIYVRDIRSYNEIEKKNKYFKWKDLTIFTDRHKQKISSSTISNYHELKSALIKGLVRDKYSEKLWSYRASKRLGIGFIVLGLFFAGIALNEYSDRDKEITPDQISTIRGTVDEPLQIEKNRRSRSIDIRVKEYPKFRFRISGIRFRAARSRELVDEISPGEMVEIDISTEAYEKKITRSKSLTFFDKVMNYHQIEVNGLRKEGDAYLALSEINQEYKMDSGGIWILFLMGVGFSSVGAYLATREKPFHPHRFTGLRNTDL